MTLLMRDNANIEKGRAEGRAEGREEMLLSSIRNIIHNMGITPDEAMRLLGVPEVEREKYRKLF